MKAIESLSIPERVLDILGQPKDTQIIGKIGEFFYFKSPHSAENTRSCSHDKCLNRAYRAVYNKTCMSTKCEYHTDEGNPYFNHFKKHAGESLIPRHIQRLKEISSFYNKDRLKRTLVPLIQQKSSVSLRLLDWLCTNYSKVHNINYMIDLDGNKILFNVHQSYKQWQRNYRRRLYDAFRRRNHVYFVSDGILHSTTVGQLNFVYWAVVYRVYDFLKENVQIVEDNMNTCLHNSRESKRITKRKRVELSEMPCEMAYIFDKPYMMKFDSDEEDEDEDEEKAPPTST